LAIALAAHGLALFLSAQRPDLSDDDSGSSVVFIELAPMPVAPPAPPEDLAPGPPQPQTESSPNEEDAPPPVAEKEQVVPPVPVPPPPPPDEAEPQALPPQQAPLVEASPQPPRSETSVATAPPSAEDHVTEIQGPAMGRVAAPVAAKVARWEQALVAQVERFKRYPPQARDLFGIARVAFSIDRSGHLVGARIVSGSGSEVLDDEALATIRRAAPFPVPPEGIADSELSFVLPIRFAPLRTEPPAGR
jgi:protein TonB